MRVSFKRVVCLLCVCLVFCSALLPSLIAPARAVALVDDVALALGLWFAGSAGITFETSKGAFQAMGKFLQDQVEIAGKIASIVASDVKDGIFTMYAAQKATYMMIVEAIKSYFTSSADSSGLLSGSLDLDGFYPALQLQAQTLDASLLADISANGTHSFSSPWGTYQCVVSHSSSSIFFEIVYPSGTVQRRDWNTYAGDLWGFGFTVDAQSNVRWVVAKKGIVYGSAVIAADFVSKGNITYLQDAAVDGTSAIKEFQNLPQESPDPDNDDEKVDIPVPIPLLPEIGTIQTGQGVDEDGNPLLNPDGSPATTPDGSPVTETKPDLDPEQIIQQLKDAIANANPSTDPDPDNPDAPSSEDERTKQHKAQWRDLFPFCVPFDLIEFLDVLAADPVAPCFEWRFYVPNVVDYTIEIDLSSFDELAKICRTMELFCFCIGLILLTRNIIRG